MRVIGGDLRGRRLAAPPGSAVRPTSDRVREAIFDILFSQGGVEGAQVVDLFAGTGALGIEALSRARPSVTFVERDPDALAAVRANLASVGPGRGRAGGDATVVRADADVLGGLDRRRASTSPCVDPPYDFDGWRVLVARLRADLAVLESGRRDHRSRGLGGHQERSGTAVRS